MFRSRRSFLRDSASAAAALPLLSAASRFAFAAVRLPNPIGAVKPCSDFDEAVKSGLDYFEPPVYELAEMSEADFASYRSKVLASPIRCTHANFFIRAPCVDGPDVDMAALKSYTELALDRCQQLGAKIVIFGSAVARSVPAGFSRDRAWQQIIEFLRMAAPIASAKDIVLGIEPIRFSSSNILSTGIEVLKMVHEINLPNIRMNIDYFQMRSMNESPQILWEARDAIVHIHFARFDPHGWPKDPNEDPEYHEFFSLLKKINYRGGISIEAPGSIADNAPATFEFMRKVLA
jgi:D-psicose/D-tagatose/L-ribulose 3-epimerase